MLGELVAQEIEAVFAQEGQPDYRVARRFYLAGSYLCQQALVSGRIDGYVEYTGTALTAILKQPLPPIGQRDAASLAATISRIYRDKYKVEVGPGMGFEDTFAMVVRGEDARRLGVKTISDVARLQKLTSRNRDMGHPGSDPTSQNRDVGHPTSAGIEKLGVGYEFEERPDGLKGLETTYGLKFQGPPRVMDLGLLYRALEAKQVDMVAGNSTDGPIRALGFVVMADDKHYFPPYEAVPLVREDSVAKHPEIQVAIERLAGKVSADEVQAMNDAVDAQHRDVGDVVREFRKGKGL